MHPLVYHGSPKQGLKVLNPSFEVKTGNVRLSATTDPVIASLFLGRKGGDYTCSLGRDKNSYLPYLVERFKGAFSLKYGLPASIYELSSKTFTTEGSIWNDELISLLPVIPMREVKIEYPKEYLFSLEREGKLIIYLFPNRPDIIPSDDSDLVKKSIDWVKLLGEDKVFRSIKKYHPNLLSKVTEGLSKL